jgi:phage-related protein
MNEGGRGELTYLPNGSQVIPHDISVQYAKEAARQSRTTENNTATTIVRQGDTINFNQPIKNTSDTYRGYKRAREVLAYE